MLCVVRGYSNPTLKGKQYKQNNTPKSYKTKIKILVNSGLAQSGFEQPGPDHFTLPAHSMDNIKLVPLELITTIRDAIRKAREAFLISKSKTLEPFG